MVIVMKTSATRIGMAFKSLMLDGTENSADTEQNRLRGMIKCAGRGANVITFDAPVAGFSTNFDLNARH